MSDSRPECLRWGAAEIAEKIRAREISSEEVVRAHIERAREVNPRINAIVEERYDQALADARDADAAVARGEEKPLLGVPFTVKEMLAMNGFLSTAGSIHRRERRVDFDATVVARVREAGAIPIGTTNVPEMGFWFETDNPVYGRTNNPYDLGRTSGGSSGGEGAIIGAGASPFGLGSDIGGSIRLPAAFCGVFGHKPTNRTVPLTGHFPFSLEDMATLTGSLYPYTSVGPLARKARDLRLLMEILVGPDDFDRETTRTFRWGPASLDVSKLRVCSLPRPRIHLTRSASDEVAGAVTNAARLLEQYGARVEEIDPKIFLRAAELWGTALKSTKPRTYAEHLSPDEPLQLGAEFFNLLRGRPNYTVPSLMTAMFERAAGGALKGKDSVLAELESLRARLDDLLGENGLLLCPPSPVPAPKHRAPWFSPFDFIYSGIFNAIGTPATAVPMGLDAGGLPLSVQIVARRGNDHLNLAVAEILEAGFGGWRPPAD